MPCGLAPPGSGFSRTGGLRRWPGNTIPKSPSFWPARGRVPRPPHVLDPSARLHEEAARRIRAVALVYAAAYLLSGVLPPLLSAERRAVFFGRTLQWLVAGVSIADALALAWLIGSSRFSARVKILAGLAFQVLGSCGIAAAEYQNVLSPIIRSDYGQADFGLSWVSVWVMMFTMVVPTPPRVALLGAALSLSAVPVMFALGENMAHRRRPSFCAWCCPIWWCCWWRTWARA